MSDKPARKKKRPKTGGRSKGTPNKSSLHIRAELAAADINLVKRYLDDVAQLETPAGRVTALQWLFHYVYPVLKEIEGPLESSEAPPPAAPAAGAARPPTAQERITLIRGQDPGKSSASG